MSFAVSVILALGIFLILVSLWGFYVSIRPPKIISHINPNDLAMEYEDVYFRTEDNINLRGWWIPKNNGLGEKTIVLLHGYPADKGDILPAFSFLHDGYNLFLFDFRYLGQSGGRYSTAGVLEQEDLLAALRYLKSRGINETGVWGFSMGAAVALVIASDVHEIKAIVSEASYASLDLMTRELYQIYGIRRSLGFLTGFWAKLFLGVDVKKAEPVDAVKKLSIPILIIHSTDDATIPFEHALMLKESLVHNTRAEFWFKDNLAHGSFGKDYQKRVTDFFAKNL